MRSDDAPRPAQSGAAESPTSRLRPAVDPATVIALRPEATADGAEWIEALVRRLMDSGAPALVIDCTEVRGVSGHLLGVLRRVAGFAAGRRVPFGVAAHGVTAETIRRHSPELVGAASCAGVLAALGFSGDARVLELVTGSVPVVDSSVVLAGSLNRSWLPVGGWDSGDRSRIEAD
ncbi:MAG TPA: hypothetical protein VK506_15965 [Conexibacter sp.]|nr:hypothetical protein [Conexibacter sp.]